MSNETLLYTQLASLVAYIGSLFGLYTLLVKQKDSVIELLKEKNTFLLEQLARADSNSPDLLAEKLSKRIEILSEELIR